MNKYYCIHISSAEERHDEVIGMLSFFPFMGIEEKYDDLFVYYDQKQWKNVSPEEIFEYVRRVDPDAKIIDVYSIDEKNWFEEWEKEVTPIQVSPNIVISPSWRRGELLAKYEIIIDPKMSFGTGHHATTRMMCRLAENLVEQGSFWIDIGTGTGVLAILAIELGAKRVLAIENNEWALENARENFKLNNVENGIELRGLDIDSIEQLPQSNGIFANLNIEILKRNLPKFVKSVESNRGDILVSGLLKYDEEEFISLCRNLNLEVVSKMAEDEWIALHLKIVRQ